MEKTEIKAARLCRIRRVPCREAGCEECGQRRWDSPDSVTPALAHVDEFGEDSSIDSGYENWVEYSRENDRRDNDSEQEAGGQHAAELERLQHELRFDSASAETTTRTGTSAADQPSRAKRRDRST